ncbi:GNAT family N-acetyltransferase [Nocardioides dongxiaopingii]|nr:GNAT family N-acetyltransferase [Nocardioides sp. S-1144]
MLAGRRQERWHPDYPRQDDLDAVSMVGPAVGGSPWGPRHVVHELRAVGTIGFYGPPDEHDEVEIGYGLVQDVWRRGIATEAIAALLTETDRVGVRVRASVLPWNVMSLRVLAKSGFTELRGADEEGQLVMARPLPRHLRGSAGGSA